MSKNAAVSTNVASKLRIRVNERLKVFNGAGGQGHLRPKGLRTERMRKAHGSAEKSRMSGTGDIAQISLTAHRCGYARAVEPGPFTP